MPPARTFDRAPGRAAAQTKPPRVMAHVEPTHDTAPLVRVETPEPYGVGQRVAAGPHRRGTVFNSCACSCGLGDKYCYVVELDVFERGSWFRFAHSSELVPI